MRKIIFNIGILTLVAKLIGFGREISLSYFFGASAITDAYLIAITIPSTIFNFIGLGLNATYIPMYNSVKEKEGDDKAILFTNNFLNILLIICTIFYIFGIVFTPQIVKIFASGFSANILNLTVKYTRICFVGIYVTVLVSILSGFLQLNNKFYIVALISMPMNIIYIVASYVASIYGDIYLPIISVIAIFSQVIFLFIPLRQIKYKHKFFLNFKDENLKKILFLSLPAIIGGSLEQINYLVDKTIASRTFIGGISILNYASRLNIAITSLLVSTVLAVLYPEISLMVAESKYTSLKNNLKKILNYIIIISIPGIFIVLIFSKELIKIVFERGEFSNKEVILTAKAFSFYTLSFLAIVIREIVTRVFYSFKDIKTPVINSSIGIVLNIILNITLTKYFGLSGIALATAISVICTSIALTILLEKKYKILVFKDNFIVFLKVFACSIFTSCIVLVFKNYFSSLSDFILVVFSGLIGVIFYLFFLKLTNISEVNEIIELFKKTIKF